MYEPNPPRTPIPRPANNASAILSSNMQRRSRDETGIAEDTGSFRGYGSRRPNPDMSRAMEADSYVRLSEQHDHLINAYGFVLQELARELLTGLTTDGIRQRLQDYEMHTPPVVIQEIKNALNAVREIV